jgi:hypothetical protein
MLLDMGRQNFNHVIYLMGLQKFEDPGWEVKNPLKNWSCPDGGF